MKGCVREATTELFVVEPLRKTYFRMQTNTEVISTEICSFSEHIMGEPVAGPHTLGIPPIMTREMVTCSLMLTQGVGTY